MIKHVKTGQIKSRCNQPRLTDELLMRHGMISVSYFFDIFPTCGGSSCHSESLLSGRHACCFTLYIPEYLQYAFKYEFAVWGCDVCVSRVAQEARLFKCHWVCCEWKCLYDDNKKYSDCDSTHSQVMKPRRKPKPKVFIWLVVHCKQFICFSSWCAVPEVQTGSVFSESHSVKCRALLHLYASLQLVAVCGRQDFLLLSQPLRIFCSLLERQGRASRRRPTRTIQGSTKTSRNTGGRQYG